VGNSQVLLSTFPIETPSSVEILKEEESVSLLIAKNQLNKIKIKRPLQTQKINNYQEIIRVL